ncbi:MAG: spermidine synthase [Alphaproteobacteria bacterium]
MLLFAISLISAGAIGYEILLMRLYSIVQWHHFAFMIISIALMGYGASGTFLAFARSRLLRHFLPAWRISAVLFGISAYGGFALTQRLAFNPLEITWEPRQLLLLSATYALLLLPFFFAATCIGLAFARHGGRIGPIYAADLGGAGLGALAAVLLMTLLPPEYGLTAALALGVLAAACISLDRQTPVWIALAVAAGILAPHDWVEPQLSEYKGLRAALFAPQAEIIAERHSPLGEITVVESPAVPFRSAPGLSLTSPHTPPEQLGVFIDGEGPQPIVRFTGDRGDIAYLDYTTEAAPYHAQDAERVLVLNAGTGVPVLLARYHGAGHIDAVEANPSLAHLLRTRFADYAGHIYNRPPVALHVAEARTFIAASHERYDLIHVPLSASRGGSIMSGLNETYTYTTDALRSYLDHLAPDGILALTREVKNPPRDALKLMAAAIDALSARGVQDPGRRLVLIRSWQTFTLLIGNEPFDERALGALRRFMSERSFDAAWYPGMKREEANRYNVLDTPQFYDGAKALLSGERRRFMSDYKFNLRPASDNRPYFNNFFKWSSLPEQVSLHADSGYPLMERGYVILIATLVQALVMGTVLILLPLPVLRGGMQDGRDDRRRTVIYFLALGFSFLFIEMVFIQRFTLFLGHPLYAISVILASFLIFAGLGAAASGAVLRFAERHWKLSPVLPIVIGIALLSLAYVAVLPGVFEALLPLPVPLKAAVTAGLIAPLAFLMGMPFPMGLARLSGRRPALVPWAWGINGCASVLSPILASLLSIHWGFDTVIVLAVACYFAAAAVWWPKPGPDAGRHTKLETDLG